eukprot:TRINITY_DN5_c0_g1_i9.p2 TRINITY_DN5_c0_g1~~TRINITY_DN5_c0_g1_i9.p2  ORF type:complete len:586 (+),score=166.82 TRINITY_DN5_c0_g1_i9:998-2755(+)
MAADDTTEQERHERKERRRQKREKERRQDNEKGKEEGNEREATGGETQEAVAATEDCDEKATRNHAKAERSREKREKAEKKERKKKKSKKDKKEKPERQRETLSEPPHQSEDQLTSGINTTNTSTAKEATSTPTQGHRKRSSSGSGTGGQDAAAYRAQCSARGSKEMAQAASTSVAAAATPALRKYRFQNSLTESLEEFNALLCEPLFTAAAHVFVLLNKVDVFTRKCAAKCTIKGCFPTFTGADADPSEAVAFITQLFVARVNSTERPFKFKVLSGSCIDDVEVILQEIQSTATATVAPVRPASAPSKITSLKLKTVESKKLKLQSGVFDTKGRRPTMEDRHLVVDSLLGLPFKQGLSLYAVFDGHGGTEAATVASEVFAAKLASDTSLLCGDVGGGLRGAFLSTDATVLERCPRSGSTAVVALIAGRTLFVANVGDSECVVGRRDGHAAVVAEVLSVKHTPTDPAEKARITANGGSVFLGRIFGTLAVSRAFGDPEFKRRAQQFVTAEPYVVARPLSRADSFVLLACDGLWERWQYQEAAEYVQANRELARSPADVARALCEEAVRRGSLDNITVILIFFTWK